MNEKIKKYEEKYKEVRNFFSNLSEKEAFMLTLGDVQLIRLGNKFTAKDWEEWRESEVGKEINELIDKYNLYDW